MINELTKRMNEYRARATRAEQENARLREQLAKPPKYAGLQKTVTEMLNLPIDTSLNEIARTLKYLRDNHDLYKAGREPRALIEAEKIQLVKDGVKLGKAQVLIEVVEAIVKLQEQNKL